MNSWPLHAIPGRSPPHLLHLWLHLWHLQNILSGSCGVLGFLDADAAIRSTACQKAVGMSVYIATSSPSHTPWSSIGNTNLLSTFGLATFDANDMIMQGGRLRRGCHTFRVEEYSRPAVFTRHGTAATSVFTVEYRMAEIALQSMRRLALCCVRSMILFTSNLVLQATCRVQTSVHTT